MVDLIILSHGGMAQAMLDSAEMIMGKQERITCMGISLGDDVDGLREQLMAAIDDASSDLLVLTDLRSGTPFNVTAAMGCRRFNHLTGINLPTLLEILVRRGEETSDQIIEDIEDIGRQTIINVNRLMEEMSA